MGETIGIVVKPNSSLAEEVARRTIAVLEELGVKFAIEESVSYEGMETYERFSLKNASMEKLIVIGGDGTLLRTVMMFQERTPVILGIRAGKRGFLLEVDRYEAEERVKDFVAGKYRIMEYHRAAVYANNRRLPCVLNDAVIAAKMGKIIRAMVSIDGQAAMRVDGDGVILSTTAGSTAHALSAGGPVVDPRLKISVIVPMNPVQLHLRPIVIPADSLVEISMMANSNEAHLFLDGQVAEELIPGSTVAMGPCEHGARMAKFRWWENFYERLYSRVLSYW